MQVLPSFFSLVVLLLLTFYVYGIYGMLLFHDTLSLHLQTAVRCDLDCLRCCPTTLRAWLN